MSLNYARMVRNDHTGDFCFVWQPSWNVRSDDVSGTGYIFFNPVSCGPFQFIFKVTYRIWDLLTGEE